MNDVLFSDLSFGITTGIKTAEWKEKITAGRKNLAEDSPVSAEKCLLHTFCLFTRHVVVAQSMVVNCEMVTYLEAVVLSESVHIAR